MFGVCDPGMAASLVTLVMTNLAGFPDDIFNNEFWVQVIHNTNAPGVAPEREIRQITDYVGATGTFTVDAFSANVEANDLVCVFHESILGIEILGYGTLTLSSTTVPEDNLRPEVNNYFRGCLLMATEGVVRFQPRRILESTIGTGAGGTGIFTLDPSNPFTTLPGLVDYVIISDQTEFIPGVDAVVNRTPADVIGGKADTALYTVTDTASLMRYIKALLTSGLAVSGAVSDAGPAITDFDTDLTEATDNHYNGMLLMFIDGPNAGQAHVIDDYGGAAKNVSFLAGDQWTDVPVDANSFVILPTLGSLLRTLHTIPGADVATNVFMRDVIGGKADTALQAATAADSLMRYIKGLLLGDSRKLFTMDCWSAGLEEVQLAAAAGDDALPSITIADLPAGATIVKAIVMFKFRMIENTYAGVNKLNGATVAATSQVIQVDDSAATGYVDAINFVDDFFTLGDAAREGGDVIIGTVDVAARVDGNDTYDFRWLQDRADQDFINFNDCQVGLRIWYSI